MKHIILSLLLLVSLTSFSQDLEKVTVNGKERTMLVYAPAELPDNAPLVISLHGAGQDAYYQRNQTHWNECADTAKIVVVYPNANGAYWDTSGTSDITYIDWVIDKMHERYNINLNRVYITGFSLGAMMTYHCMEHLGKKVAAFGPVSGVRFDNRAPIAPRRVPFIHTHGTGDDVFKWVGDPGHMAGGYPYIPDYVESWAKYEDLTEKTTTAPYPSTKQNSIASLTVWSSTDPNDNIEIALLALKDKGHWHSEDLASGVSTTQEIWRFCKRYSLQPEPPKMKSAEPEDLSFDLTDAQREFTITFDGLADASCIHAEMKTNGLTTPLEFAGTENSEIVKVKVPDNITLIDGEYELVISGIKNPEGGQEKSVTLHYYYGPSETGNQIKENFKNLYERAIKLYELTEDATLLSIVNARTRLKKYIDKYVEFSSTSPSAYAKAAENLQKNMDILQSYLDSTGITDVNIDSDPQSIQYYNLEGQRLNTPQKGLNIVVSTYASGKYQVQKIYK